MAIEAGDFKTGLTMTAGCEDHYLFTGKSVDGKSLLDVLELNEEVNDIFSNQRITGILGNIAYDCENDISISAADSTNTFQPPSSEK